MKEQYTRILVEFYERISSGEHSVVADRDISLPQMHLLEIVGGAQRIRMKELASLLGVTTGTLTVMVHRLVSNGYLLKEKDDSDRRSYFVTLSQRGREEYENHHLMHEQLIEELLAGLGDESGEQLFALLQRCNSVL